MVIGSAFWEEAKEYVVGKQEQRKQKKKRKATIAEKEKPKEEEYVGPDTSSLTAFLTSLLSLSEPSAPEDEENAADGSDSEGERSDSSFQSKLEQQGGHEREQEEQPSDVEPGGGPEKGAGVGLRPGTSGGDELDSDWQLVSEKDFVMNTRYFDPPMVQAMQQQMEPPKPQPPPQPVPLKLPTMSEVSSLLSEDFRSIIYPSLPTLAKGRQWVLLYSTVKHGISLRTLYRKSGLIPGPCLLVVGDRLGAVFGGLISTPFKPTPKKKYQGTNDSFVFSNVGGKPQVFRPTGANRYYVLCTNDALAFGGGGHFALHLDSELLYGSSASCETYGNLGLASTTDFVIKNVESTRKEVISIFPRFGPQIRQTGEFVYNCPDFSHHVNWDVRLWGFAHTSRYVPFHAFFKEPEVVRGIYSW